MVRAARAPSPHLSWRAGALDGLRILAALAVGRAWAGIRAGPRRISRSARLVAIDLSRRRALTTRRRVAHRPRRICQRGHPLLAAREQRIVGLPEHEAGVAPFHDDRHIKTRAPA